MKISAVIIAFNEEKNIGAAIESVAWADEVIVVDSESTDRTRDIAQSHGAKVIVNPWPGFSAQKQFATDQAGHDWVLSLDADERVSDALCNEIRMLAESGPSADGFYIPRLSFYAGRAVRHGGWYPDKQMRLFDRRRGQWSERVIHESFCLGPGAREGTLNGDLHHFTVASPAEHHRMIGERYAPLAARQMLNEGRRTSPFKAVVSAWASFVRGYILKAGFLDGFAGFCIAYFAAHNTLLKHLMLIELRERSTSQNRDP